MQAVGHVCKVCPTNCLNRPPPPLSPPPQWPYCLRRCTYCNFNKYISRGDKDHVMTECLQRETETLLQLSQVSWYGNPSDGVIPRPGSLDLPFKRFDFSTQHYLCIFWGWDPEPGSPLNRCCSLGNGLQTGEFLRQGRGHA